jgi:hypothetical protein
MKLTNIFINKFKSQSANNKLNEDSLNGGILSEFSKSVSNFYGTCYNKEPSRFSNIYNLLKNLLIMNKLLKILIQNSYLPLSLF